MISRTRLLVYGFPAGILFVAVCFVVFQLIAPDRTVIVGMVEATEISVAPKIPGRVDTILVREGDRVERGQLLARLESKEIDAKVEQARGAMDAARAKLDMAQRGARVEELESVEKMYLQAQYQFELAEKTLTRMSSMFADSVISEQEFDEITFKFQAAREQRDAARARYNMVSEGTRSEEIRMAVGLFHQAKNAFNEAIAYQQETSLVSPLNGEVSDRIVDPGEIVAGGYPVITILDIGDVWIVVQLREDQLRGIRMGLAVTGSIPAVDDDDHEFRVTSIAAMADFATWRATNQKGDFDLRTFEIHLRPEQPIDGLRPGMTVRLFL